MLVTRWVVIDGAGRPGQAADAGAQAALAAAEAAAAEGSGVDAGDAATDAATSARPGTANQDFKSFLPHQWRRGKVSRRTQIVTASRGPSSVVAGKTNADAPGFS
ncbi:MAG: hypothetical protein ACJ8GJ_11615 [Vitreoscilla sp.]